MYSWNKSSWLNEEIKYAEKKIEIRCQLVFEINGNVLLPAQRGLKRSYKNWW
jgi:hypothetical protein